MAHLIDKDALVAEIEIQKDEHLKYSRNKFHAEWSCGTLDNILRFIDTLEVKEVDLNEEIEKCLKRHSMLAVGKKDFTDIARHFFELGMQVSNKAQKGEQYDRQRENS